MRCEDEAPLCYGYFYGPGVHPVQTPSLPVQEKAKKMISNLRERLNSKILLTALRSSPGLGPS